MTTPPRLTLHGPGRFRGVLRVPGDKSISHRAVLLSALAHGASSLTGLSQGEDVRHTLRAVQALGADVTREQVDGGDVVVVRGGSLHEPASVIDTGNSGTGIRLLAGVAAGLPGLTVLHGDASIAARPMDRVAVPLRQMGARIDGRDGGRYPPLAVRGGPLRGIEYDLPVASAQVKSAVLLAALSSSGPTTVREPVRSRAHTEQMLSLRGAHVVVDGAAVTLYPSALQARDEVVPGDPSQAAFWLVGAAAVPGSDVTVTGVYLGVARGGFLEVLRRMGADVRIEADPDGRSHTVRVRGAELRGTQIEPGEIAGLIDEIPALCVAAALADGVTTVRGAAELRVKESDRLSTTAAMLRAFGVRVAELDDGLVVTGTTALHGGQVNSHGDHRIAMAAAIAAVAASGESVLDGFDAVATSYPSFLTDLQLCAHDVRVTQHAD